jgi:hypothetical protein
LISSDFTDQIIVQTEFHANSKCGGFQSMSAVFQIIDSKIAFWVMPITRTKWQLKWNDDYTIIQLQQLDPQTNLIDPTCLNQLKRYTSTTTLTDQSRKEHSNFDLVFTPPHILSTSGSLSITFPSDDSSHSLYLKVEQVGRSSRFDLFVYLQANPNPSSSPTTTNLLNAEFVTLHYISPTSLQSSTAVMASRAQQHCVPTNEANLNALKWKCQISIPSTTPAIGARVAFTYRISPIQTNNSIFTNRSSQDGTNVVVDKEKLYQSDTVYIQNNFSTVSNTFFAADGSQINAITMAYTDRYHDLPKVEVEVPNTNGGEQSNGTNGTNGQAGTNGQGNTNTQTPTTPNNTNPNTIPTPVKPKPIIPADFRELFAGDWTSTKSCKSSSNCCCLTDKEKVAMKVYLPQQAKDANMSASIDGIDVKNTKQIVVVGYLDTASSCFGLKELKGTCEIDLETKKGTCNMSGVKMTAQVNEDTGVISVDNSMFKDCTSQAIKIEK